MHRVFINDDSVPVEEFETVVDLLTDHQIDYVERKRLIGSLFRFGSTGAGCDLMVESETDARRARTLINEYQRTLVDSSRADYAANVASNRRRELVGWAISLTVIAIVLALSLSIGL